MASTHDVLDFYLLNREVERRAQQYGLVVRFDETINTAYTNGKELVFPKFKFPLSDVDYIQLKSMSIHEPLHVNRKELFSICKREGIHMGSPLGYTLNAVEDEIMEHEHCNLYAGDKKDLGIAHNLYTDRLTNSIKDNPTLDDKGKNIVTLAAILAKARTKWDSNAEVAYLDLYDSLPDDVKQKVDSLIQDGWVDKLNNIGDPNLSYKLARELYESVFNKDPDSPESKRQESNSGQQENSGKDSGKVKGKKGEAEDGEGKGDKVSWEDILKSPCDQKATNKNFHNGIDFTGKNTNNTFTPFPLANTSLVDLKSKEITDYSCHHVGSNLDEKDFLNHRIFANKIKRLLLIETRSDFQSERKSGKISKRNISRIAQPLRGSGDWNSRIFKRRIDKRNVDTCITILVDWSGSMSGEKMALAALSCYNMFYTFGTVLRIPTEVLAFTTSHNAVIHGVVKHYTEKLITKDVMFGRFAKFESYSSGNADADALLWAASRIVKRPEKRKIIMVLSDGSPSYSYDYSDADFGLKQTFAGINKKGLIQVYGIGIQDNNVTRYYGKNSPVVNNVEELDKKVIQVLHDKIIKEPIL